ncbi:MAG: DNA (cytosine-5-)-methyltransferase, partial [Planctomycetota bacterium]
MADFLTAEDRSALMSRVRSRGSAPELALEAALAARGLKAERHVERLPGRPDFVFERERLAVFVDGDLWHGGQWRRRGCAHLHEPFEGAERRGYWQRKVSGNIRRDLERTDALLSSGWRVLRRWGSDLASDADVQGVCDQVERALAGTEKPAPGWMTQIGRSADFFSGIGLMSRGVHAAGWRTVWANDYDATKRRLFLHNASALQRAGVEDPAITLESRSIHDVGPKSVPGVGLIASCFPCTDLSLAGKARGIEAGPQSSAYLRFVDILSRMGGKRPPFVILENVLGLAHSHGGRDLGLCLELLQNAGYRVDVLAMDAKRFVPQSRPRMFVVGIRREVEVGPLLSMVEATTPSTVRPALLADFIAKRPDLDWAVRPMPEPPAASAVLLEDVLDAYDAESPAWWSDKRAAYFKSQAWDRHRAKVDEVVRERGVCHATAFRRMRDGKSTAELRFDGIAGCLRTPKGGSAKQMLVRVTEGGWRVRYLSAAECARLMGADGFRTDAEGVRETDALFGFGDAVCVPAVRWVIEHHINPVMAELLRGRLLVRS